MLSLCAAAALDEIRRLIRARAAIASARSIFTMLSAKLHLRVYSLAFSSSRGRYQAPAHLVVSYDGQQAAVQDDDLFAERPPDDEQRIH